MVFWDSIHDSPQVFTGSPIISQHETNIPNPQIFGGYPGYYQFTMNNLIFSLNIQKRLHPPVEIQYVFYVKSGEKKQCKTFWDLVLTEMTRWKWKWDTSSCDVLHRAVWSVSGTVRIKVKRKNHYIDFLKVKWDCTLGAVFHGLQGVEALVNINDTIN